ncbi:MAG: HAMP domain-containing protein [Gemmatimonadetes bacterium]|nr:HAMP domain-containing protein [Gemmatimonadota bacterium]
MRFASVRARSGALPSLRRGLVVGLTLVLMAALGVGTLAMYTVLRLFPQATPAQIVAYLGVIMALDVAIFAAYGHYKLSRLVLRAVDAMVAGAGNIAAGAYEARLDETAGAAELSRLAGSVNAMAERLIQNQRTLAENVRSLDETNRLLTQARDELIRAEKLASVGQLAAGIAHEVGNPLGAILGHLDVARRRGQVEGVLYEDLKREAVRIDRIVRGLLDYSRARQAAPRPLDVNAVVRGAVELLEAQGRFQGIAVDLHLAEQIPAVRADPTQLEQVLVNLLLNAAEAVGDGRGERVELRTEVTRWEPARLRGVGATAGRRRDDPPGVNYSHLRRLRQIGVTAPDARFTVGAELVKIVVRDDGPGIPDEIRARIFEPFFTTKEPGRGTGLGLAVAQRLIEGMDGTIEAANAGERSTGAAGGAVFTILLPAGREEMEAET